MMRRACAVLTGMATAATLVVGVGGGASTAEPASAQRVAVTKVKMSTRFTDDRETVGWASARMTITWKSRTKAVVRGWVQDHCPGDGNEAQVRLYNQKTQRHVFEDDRGCDARKRKPFYGKVKGPGGKKLRYITVIVGEYSPSKNYIVDLETRKYYNKLL